MAQHDMNIANQGFPATRADLNNALQALVSNSSGTSAPSTTFANQWWYDTTNNKMYIRNEANNAWIEVFTLDQTSNEWQLTTGVVQAKDSDGLALKTDDGTTRLFIKDSDGSIGIGTTSPNPAGVNIVTGGGSKGVLLARNDGSGSPTSGQGFGSFAFKGIMDGSNSIAAAEASIEAIAAENHSGSTAATSLAFYTKPSGTGPGSGPTERMRILASGGLTFNGDTADANALDDYEEGTWTPVFKSGTTTMTTTNPVGQYVKTGRMVFVQGSLQRNDSTFLNQIVGIQGLPYARDTITYLTPLGAGWAWLDLGAGSDQTMLAYHASDQIQWVFDSRVVNTRYFYANSFTNGRYFYFCSTYKASS